MQKLETLRVILRDWQLSDLDDFYDYAKNPNVGPNAGWKPHESKDEALNILSKFIENQEVWAIYHKLDKKVIGSIGVHNKNGEMELGYVLSEDYWGQGITVEAAKEVIQYFFEEKTLDKMLVFHFVENMQSKRVIEKLGFKYIGPEKGRFTRYDGKVMDSLAYEMTNEQYGGKK